MTPTRILLLPGWQNSGPSHWQSRWEAQHGFERLQQDDWWWPRRGDWMAQLDEALLADARATVLVAHSLGCQLVAAWAGHSQHTARVAAALLVALPDIDREDMPPQLQAWGPIPTRALPMATTAVLSSNDPYCDAARGLQMAADWGCAIHTLGPAGHINGDSGLGDWPEGITLLQDLMQRAGLPAPALGR
jgi:hypothetical protein